MADNTSILDYFSVPVQDTDDLTLQEVDKPMLEENIIDYFSDPHTVENTRESGEEKETKMTPKDVSILEYFSEPIPEISLSREIAYGQAQEPLALGSAYRLAKAGIDSFFNRNETYAEARERIEDARQDKIFEEFSEFRGREETAGTLTGRASVAVFDPVTFMIPWAKFAKLGKLASLGAGGTFAAGDMALREEALYGEINPYTVGLGFGLGVAGAQAGDMIMAAYSRYASQPIKEIIQVQNAAGQKVGKPVTISGSQSTPMIKQADLSKVDTLIKNITIDSEEALKNIGTLTTRINNIGTRRLEISAELKKIKGQHKKVLTKEELAEDDYFTFVTATAQGERKKLTLEVRAINNELSDIYLEELPDNLLDVINKSILNGQKSGLLNERFARSIIQETVRPLVGGIIGGGIGATFTEEGEGNEKMLTLMALGAMAGKFQKTIQSAPYKIVPKTIRDDAGNEIVKEYRRSFWNYMKGLTAASHVQELLSFSKPLVNYAAKMFKMQGGGVRLGFRTKELSVEEEAILQKGYWKDLYFDLISKYDDDVLELAGKLSNNKNLKSTKYSFLTNEDKVSSKLAQAEKLSLEIDKFTLDFRNYAVSRGLDFDDEAQYGLTQLLKQDAIDTVNYTEAITDLANAFFIQNSKEVGHIVYKPKGKTQVAAARKHARNVAVEYLQTSTSLRAKSIWKKETDDAIFQSNSIGKDRDEEFVLNAARHFNKSRTLYDQEARASVAHLFEQNPAETLRQLINNTVSIAEFVKRFGAKGEGIKKLFNDIDNEIKLMADPTNKYNTVKDLYGEVPAARARAQAEKKKIKDSLEAWFGVYQIDQMPTSPTGQAVVTFLQTGLATTRLARVSIPSLGDLLQTVTNSGYKAAYKAAVSDIKLSKEGLGLRGTKKQVDGKDATFMDKFLGKNRVDDIVDRELSDVLLVGGGNIKRYQQKTLNFTRQFFEAIQLGRVTRLSRNWAFDSGVHRAMDIGQTVKKGKTSEFLKTKEALQKEMDVLSLSKKDFQYLGQFDTLEKAIADPTAKSYLKKAGLKSADRDALIPQIANRRLFTQSKNPYVKFLGSFMSWAQAKSSQTNALVSRVEQGDAALFLRMAAALPIFMAVRETQVALTTNRNYKEQVGEETLAQKIGEGISYTGLNTYLIEKIRSIIKYDGYGSNTMEQVAPVLGYMEDMTEIIRRPVGKMLDSEADTALEILGSGVKETAEVLPFVREVVPVVERAIGEEADNDPLRSYAIGGIVEGEDNVPYTKENPAERINPYTGESYTALYYNTIQRQPFNDGNLVEKAGGVVKSFYDTARSMSSPKNVLRTIEARRKYLSNELYTTTDEKSNELMNATREEWNTYNNQKNLMEQELDKLEEYQSQLLSTNPQNPVETTKDFVSNVVQQGVLSKFNKLGSAVPSLNVGEGRIIEGEFERELANANITESYAGETPLLPSIYEPELLEERALDLGEYGEYNKFLRNIQAGQEKGSSLQLLKGATGPKSKFPLSKSELEDMNLYNLIGKTPTLEEIGETFSGPATTREELLSIAEDRSPKLKQQEYYPASTEGRFTSTVESIDPVDGTTDYSIIEADDILEDLSLLNNNYQKFIKNLEAGKEPSKALESFYESKREFDYSKYSKEIAFLEEAEIAGHDLTNSDWVKEVFVDDSGLLAANIYDEVYDLSDEERQIIFDNTIVNPDKFPDLAENIARVKFFDSPYTHITPDLDTWEVDNVEDMEWLSGISMYGSEDTGWNLIDKTDPQGRRILTEAGDPFYGDAEAAQFALQDYIKNVGVIETMKDDQMLMSSQGINMGTLPDPKEYVEFMVKETDEEDTYQTKGYTQNPQHWGSEYEAENAIGWAQLSTRNLADGSQSQHAEAIQSDLHQAANSPDISGLRTGYKSDRERDMKAVTKHLETVLKDFEITSNPIEQFEDTLGANSFMFKNIKQTDTMKDLVKDIIVDESLEGDMREANIDASFNVLKRYLFKPIIETELISFDKEKVVSSILADEAGLKVIKEEYAELKKEYSMEKLKKLARAHIIKQTAKEILSSPISSALSLEVNNVRLDNIPVNNRYYYDMVEDAIPDLPMKGGEWRKSIWKRSINRGIQNGKTKFSWSPAWIQKIHWGQEDAPIHKVADQDLARLSKNLAKEYGGKFKTEQLIITRAEIESGKGSINITKVLQEIINDPKKGNFKIYGKFLYEEKEGGDIFKGKVPDDISDVRGLVTEIRINVPVLDLTGKAVGKWKRLGYAMAKGGLVQQMQGLRLT